MKRAEARVLFYHKDCFQCIDEEKQARGARDLPEVVQRNRPRQEHRVPKFCLEEAH